MPSTRSRAERVSLRRRGVRHGTYSVAREGASDLSDPEFLRQVSELWAGDEPIVLRGASARAVARRGKAIARSVELFERLRDGASFEAELWRRLGKRSSFRPAGVTIDMGDSREIEKVFVDGVSGVRATARDLYAKLSWVAFDERDASLRIRFSFGAESLLDWQKETRRAAWSDRFAEAVFPECDVIASNEALLKLVEQQVGRRIRVSERIVYSNAPDGGATFHHDDEPRQLGVIYMQLAGSTAWLALPKRSLAEFVAATARGAKLKARAGTPRKALRALDETGDPALGKLLNATPAFTARLVEAGRLRVVHAGDSILLPSHGPDDVCWHSVFALGREPSLSHSYGVFAARETPVSEARSRGTLRSSARSRDAR